MSLVKPRDCFLDVGANVGYYTVLVAERVGSTGQVFAIEPNATNFEILDANTRICQREGCVRIYRNTLSDEAGLSNFF